MHRINYMRNYMRDYRDEKLKSIKCKRCGRIIQFLGELNLDNSYLKKHTVTKICNKNPTNKTFENDFPFDSEDITIQIKKPIYETRWIVKL